MLIKLKRKDCIEMYPSFPIRIYDNGQDEEMFHYPKVFNGYILTLSSKSFRGHVGKLGVELLKLSDQLGYDQLIFLGDTELAWLHQNNEYRPAKEAQKYLVEQKIGQRFNGALKVGNSYLLTFVKHLSWLTRCNASLPHFYFLDGGQNLLGHICKYGNLHIDTLNEVTDKGFNNAIKDSGFKFLDIGDCFNHFGKTNVIPGRRIIV